MPLLGDGEGRMTPGRSPSPQWIIVLYVNGLSYIANVKKFAPAEPLPVGGGANLEHFHLPVTEHHAKFRLSNQTLWACVEHILWKFRHTDGHPHSGQTPGSSIIIILKKHFNNSPSLMYPIPKYVNSVITVHERLAFVLSFLICLFFVCFFICLCPHSFMFPWAVESSPLQFLALA